MVQNKFKYTILTIFYIFFLFYISSLPDSSLTIGRSTLEKILWNLAHIPLYGVLATLLYFTFKNREKINKSFLKSNWFVFMITICISFMDELNQTTVFGRSASLIDIFLDITGILIAVWIITFVNSKSKIPNTK